MDTLATTLNGNTLRVLAYLLAGGLAWLAAVRTAGDSGRHGWVVPGFWAIAGSMLVLLAISREIDLSSRIANSGRDFFRTEGWYPDRRPLQKFAILAVVAVSGVVAVCGSWLLLRRHREQLLFGFVAMVGLAMFLAVRAISWHNLDAVLYRRSIEQVQVNALVELVATALTALAAVFAIVGRQPHRSSSAR